MAFSNKTSVGSVSIALWFCIMIVCSGLTGFVTHKLTKPKTAFVRTGELLDKYHGTKEAQASLEQTRNQMKVNLDTLQKEYQFALNKYSKEMSGLSSDERKHRELVLAKQEQSLMQYGRSAQASFHGEEDKLMNGVLQQINSIIEKYGKEHNYDYIFGSTTSGSILYAEKGEDITEELIDIINAEYNPKSEGINANPTSQK